MVLAPWPNRYVAAAFAAAKGFFFVPRVGEIKTVTNQTPYVYIEPYIDADGWQPPYEDEQGNPISEDGINPGTIGPGLNKAMPALTDDDSTTRQLGRNSGGAWKLNRTPPDNFGNLDWRNADASEVLTWIGPPNRYWSFRNESNPWYQPRIYRRGQLYATAPERVIGCALHREAGLRIVVAATTSFPNGAGTFTLQGDGLEFADGQVDESAMYCRVADYGDETTTELWDASEFDALVAQYEAATTAAAQDDLRTQIKNYAGRWHDLQLRGHAALIDTSIPEMQSAQYPNRRIPADVWPWHFNASGNQGQTLRRQSAYSAATLSNGMDISADVRAYRYERIKVDIAFGVQTVTIDKGKITEFEVQILAPTITPQRIHGDRFPRLDVQADFNVIDNSEAEPAQTNGTTFTSLDVDNTMGFDQSRSGSVVIAVDYVGDAEVLGYLDLSDAITADSEIIATVVRIGYFSYPDFFWLIQTQSVAWTGSFDRTTSLALRWGVYSATLRDITVHATIDSNVSEASSGDFSGTVSYSANVTAIEREIQFADLRGDTAVLREQEDDVTLGGDRDIGPLADGAPRVTGDYPDVGWTIDSASIAAVDARLNLRDFFDATYGTTSRTTRIRLVTDGAAPQTLLDNLSADVSGPGAPADSHVSIYIPPFKASSIAGAYAGFSVEGLASAAGGMATSGETDRLALAGLQQEIAPMGNWAASPAGDLIGSQLVATPIESSGETQYDAVNYITGDDLVTLNGLTIPAGQQAAFYSCAFVGD